MLRYEADLKFQVKCKPWLFGNISIILEIRKNWPPSQDVVSDIVLLTKCSTHGFGR